MIRRDCASSLAMRSEGWGDPERCQAAGTAIELPGSITVDPKKAVEPRIPNAHGCIVIMILEPPKITCDYFGRKSQDLPEDCSPRQIQSMSKVSPQNLPTSLSWTKTSVESGCGPCRCELPGSWPRSPTDGLIDANLRC